MTNTDDISLDEWLGAALCASFSAKKQKFLDNEIPFHRLSKRWKKRIIFTLRVFESLGLAEENIDDEYTFWHASESLQDLMESRDKMKNETS